MAASDLTSERKRDGHELLARLQAAGIEIFAGFWIFTAAVAEWRLVIVTPEIDRRGPKALLRSAYDALQALEVEASFTFFDVDFRSPHSAATLLLAEQLEPFATEHEYTRRDLRSGDAFIEHLFVYEFDQARIIAANDTHSRLAAE